MGCLAVAQETLGRSLVLPTFVFIAQNGIKDVYSDGLDLPICFRRAAISPLATG
jgi:hypothetical protein